MKAKEYYKLLNIEELNKKRREYGQKCRDNLTDVYIIKTLTDRSNLTNKDIPQELVEAKRQYVKIKRITKET